MMKMEMMIMRALHAAPAAAAAQHAGHEPQGAARVQAVGMNAKWTEAHVDVAQWARRFTDPGRDVIAHRKAIVEALQLQPGQAVADVGARTSAYLAARARAQHGHPRQGRLNPHRRSRWL
jgi:hypothetical protein